MPEVGVGAGAGWSRDSGHQAGGNFENAQSFFCVFSRPGASLSSPECGGRGVVRGGPGAWAGGLLPYPGVSLFTLRGGGGLCGGKKERVKSSVHMAPVFTMEKEGGHYLSLGSVLDTLWLC